MYLAEEKDPNQDAGKTEGCQGKEIRLS